MGTLYIPYFYVANALLPTREDANMSEFMPLKRSLPQMVAAMIILYRKL